MAMDSGCHSIGGVCRMVVSELERNSLTLGMVKVVGERSRRRVQISSFRFSRHLWISHVFNGVSRRDCDWYSVLDLVSN
jgi:hypothetical protein